jgi:hypothetical protein
VEILQGFTISARTSGTEEDAAMKADNRRILGRRQFLRVLGIGAAATAAQPLVTGAKADSETNDEKRKSRYRESDHIKQFYRVNRYPI